ncbi:MAG TPA: MipA/OmpV family protein [Luteibacter sp.]|jgi:outer membrane protein|nr:MipA/OmpV family protein [Luteibacter sp.]
MFADKTIRACLLGATLLLACASRADEAPTVALGAGVERMPSWVGADTHRNQPIPYIDIDIPGYGELSTVDGLTVDFIQGEKLHGGIYGNYLWGRTCDDLGAALCGKVPSLSPRIHGGGYLEYKFDKTWSIGTQLSHDTRGAGLYEAIYADWQLPDVWYIEHSLEVQWNGTNGAAARRFFGVTPTQATALGTEPWHPGAGSQLAYIEYDAFVPTSRQTGFAVAINYGRLLGDAADSPLVRQFGSRNQLETTLAFVYHFSP